ncbi:hypothetical protein MNBD_GAMMA12-2634 [hydrothermal vent metagenome]|uniref:Uncharacterized protein n=1 Tax=hydrothermal vent metagenome TaxID=652676 RepID=A0A3B0ZP11_9ZZZZ
MNSRKIKDAKMDIEHLLKITPMITALFAVIVSPLISVYITKKQLRASVNSKSRQEWINLLREEITNYLFGLIKFDSMKFDNQMALKNKNKTLPHSPQDLTKLLDDLQKHKIKISLLINPSEADSKKLIAALEDSYLNIAKESLNQKKIESNILQLSQSILKKEWQRVKSLE